MDASVFIQFCHLLDDLSEAFLPQYSLAITFGAAVIGWLGLITMAFGLTLVRVLCVLVCLPILIAVGIPLAEGYGMPGWLGILGGVGVSLIAGALLYRVLLVGLIALTLASFGVISLGANVWQDIDWNALTKPSERVATYAGRSSQDGLLSDDPWAERKAEWQEFVGRLQASYANLVEKRPWLPWAIGIVAVASLLIAVAAVIWIWRIATIVISVILGAELLFIGGGLFLLRELPETFTHLANNVNTVLIVLAMLAAVGAFWQLRHYAGRKESPREAPAG